MLDGQVCSLYGYFSGRELVKILVAEVVKYCVGLDFAVFAAFDERCCCINEYINIHV